MPAAAGVWLLLAALLVGCASTSTKVSLPAKPPPPPPAPAAAPPEAPSGVDSLSPEEVRDLAALQAETFHGPVGSSNADLDDELENFLREESDALLTEKVGYDIPIVINDRVEYFVDYFQNRVNESFAKWLARSSQYVPYLKARFQQAGLPEDLVYLALIESGFSAQATSHANAVGYWQFIAGTARRYGLRVNPWVDERRDFERSTEAAIAYLKDLHRMFGSWYLAAAAYNSGEARIQKAIERYGSENLWELSEFSYLREETKGYVPKLIAAILIAKEPDKYGFRGVPELPPVEVDVVTVPTQSDLIVIAAAAGATVETIRTLNPMLRSYATPPGVTDFEVKVPRGRGDLFRARYAQIPPSRRLLVRYHTVRRGESPGRIAARYGVSVKALMAENGLRNPRKLRAGQRLRIPRPLRSWEVEVPPVQIAARTAPESGLASASSGDRMDAPAGNPLASEKAVPSSASGMAAGSAPAAGSAALEPTGDAALASAAPSTAAPATAADTSGQSPSAAPGPVGALPQHVAWTAPEPVGREAPGELVEVPASAVQLSPPPARAVPSAPSVTRYEVRPGDTLYRIALGYGVTVADMQRWNPGLTARLLPGTILRIQAPGEVPAADPATALEREALSSAPAAAEPSGAADEVPRRFIVYRVREGDTLPSIARRYGVALEQLQRWNGMKGTRVKTGEPLVIRTEPPAGGR